MNKIIIPKNRGLFYGSKNASKLLAQQINKCIDYINWLEYRNGYLTNKIDKLEERIKVLESED